MNKAGYEYLLAYKINVPIYDYTIEFCRRWISPRSRTYDQMVQAGRSGMQNLPEGYKQSSLKGYLRLTGVSRGSLEELLNDFLSFARQKKIEVWKKEKVIREIREIGEIWDVLKRSPTLPDNPNFPDLPTDPEKAVNLMITLINQANYLLDKLIVSLEKKFVSEGGYTEKLFRKRINFRTQNK